MNPFTNRPRKPKTNEKLAINQINIDISFFSFNFSIWFSVFLFSNFYFTFFSFLFCIESEQVEMTFGDFIKPKNVHFNYYFSFVLFLLKWKTCSNIIINGWFIEKANKTKQNPNIETKRTGGQWIWCYPCQKKKRWYFWKFQI